MAVTIKDVAKLAEVSISTVSRVINESKPVSPEARRKVLHAIEELGYEPNEVARSLVTKKSNLIGVIVDDIGSYYVSQIVRGIEEIGRMYNYDILLSSSYKSKETELKFLQLLKKKQVEGIIVVSEILNEELIEQLNKSKIEYMYFNKYHKIPGVSTIELDNKNSIKEMTKHLISQGHEKILYVSQNNSELTNEKIKTVGYKEIISEYKFKPYTYEINGNGIDTGYKEGKNILEEINKNNISAVFCAEDEIAIGLINYFYDVGIKVPEDISVVGYGDTNVSSIFRPTLTTIKKPYYDIGAVSIRIMLKKLIGEPIDESNIILPMPLIKRESDKKI